MFSLSFSGRICDLSHRGVSPRNRRPPWGVFFSFGLPSMLSRFNKRAQSIYRTLLLKPPLGNDVYGSRIRKKRIVVDKLQAKKNRYVNILKLCKYPPTHVWYLLLSLSWQFHVSPPAAQLILFFAKVCRSYLLRVFQPAPWRSVYAHGSCTNRSGSLLGWQVCSSTHIQITFVNSYSFFLSAFFGGLSTWILGDGPTNRWNVIHLTYPCGVKGDWANYLSIPFQADQLD